MGFYLIRAKIKDNKLEGLYHLLVDGYIEAIEPFGEALSYSLSNARVDPETNEVLWEEECYCNPPLAMEMKSIINKFFEISSVVEVAKGEGWRRIRGYPRLWEANRFK